MNKTAIKQFAVWARRELISAVMQRAQLFGIVKGAPLDAELQGINGKLFTESEKAQRCALIEKIKRDGFDQAMEEIAYTWFNRFTALRFMEVNGYLPSYIRVFTNSENEFKPQILTEALDIELDRLDKDKVRELKLANKEEELYKYLLITQCNALNEILPRMFQPIEDYTELLFPDYILRKDSVLDRMVSQIPEDDWKDAVQIIGWLYQYYNAEPKDQVFAKVRQGSNKVSKDDIPAVTQLFTPDWIVRYMVENSLGRLWQEGHSDSTLKADWKYYLEEAAQNTATEEKLAEIRKAYAGVNPEEISCIDPCMGSGHILVYMFEVLMQIYQSCGYTAKDAVRLIIEKNLHGLELDERATQLAYFAVMMSARKYDSRFFSRGLQPNLYCVSESNNLDRALIETLWQGDKNVENVFEQLSCEMFDAKEYGSVLEVTPFDFSAAENAIIYYFDNGNGLYDKYYDNVVVPYLMAAKLLSQKYDVVVTNPPYMSSAQMDEKLAKFVKDNYPDSKADMFAVFMERCQKMTKENGFTAMITMHSWMFLSSFEKLREKMQKVTTINMAHLGARAFDEIGGEVVQTTAFVTRNLTLEDYKAKYIRLVDYGSETAKAEEFSNSANLYEAAQTNFSKIPGSPIGYWVSEKLLDAFENGKRLDTIAEPRQGLATADNNRFLRQWYEVDTDNIKFDAQDREEAKESGCKWFPYNKGGDFRKWYGNNDYVINWQNDGYEIRNFKDLNGKLRSVVRNPNTYFKECISWSKISSGNMAFRYKPQGHIYDVAGTSIFTENKRETLLKLGGFCNSKVALQIANIISPTLNYEVGHIASFPILEFDYELVNPTVRNCIALSKADWDAFETSWDFVRHPLVNGAGSLAEAFEKWECECRERFDRLKANEEELNRIFIGIYGLESELTPEVEDRDVTVRLADRARDVRSLISYAVGCMFGRYSLDREGLVFAGGEFNAADYLSFAADGDAIIPICDDDYFSGDNDIVGRFVEFVRIVYGDSSLEENLRFVADALGGSGDARDVIRGYFLNDFYADHLKIYQKRPIYWLFDSGKKNGFKALAYMHRYTPDMLARLRTDYVHVLQRRYEAAIESATEDLSRATASQSGRLNARLKHLREQAEEIRKFEELVHHFADRRLAIDLDNGVKLNYALFGDVLAKIK